MKHPFAWLVLLLATMPTHAAKPRDELLRLVPEDIGFCLTVQDLRSHWAAVAGSPLAELLRESAIGKGLHQTREWQQLADAERMLRQHLGIGWKELRDDILGDAVVLAYRPGPPGKPEQEQGLLLVRSRNAEILTETVSRLNEAQRTLEELKLLEERQHLGVKYFYRVERNHAPYFYWIDGAILAASPQEEMLKQAIERSKQPPAEPALARPFRQLGAEESLASLWVNPRAFEAEMVAKAASASASDAAFLNHLLVYWKALDDIVLAVTPGQELEVTLGLRGRPEGLPPAGRKFLAELAQPSELWHALPSNRAMLVVAARVDFAAWLQALVGFLPEEARSAVEQSIGQRSPFGKLFRDMLGQLGPDAGFAVVAPAESESQWTPHVLWALRVRPLPGRPTAHNILDGLNALAVLAVLDYNGKHPDRLSLKSEQDGDVEIKSFVHVKLYPPSWQPAYALKKDFLLFGSTPAVIRSFEPAAAKPASSSATPILQVSLSALRTYVAERRDALIGFVVEQQQLSREQAGRRLDHLLATLQFLDRIDLTQHVDANQVRLTLRIKASQPLRK